MKTNSPDNQSTAQGVVFADAHVHIHDCFDESRFLDAAARNFLNQARIRTSGGAAFVIFLTESAGADKFGTFAKRAKNESRTNRSGGEAWDFSFTDDERCLVARRSRGCELEIVAGRQIVTAERLEVLALGTLQKWKDGLPIGAVIESIREVGAIPVLPWGFGKWLGQRGRVIGSLMEEFGNGSVYLGDNGGRPRIIPDPQQFEIADQRGIRILPGSDPLPFLRNTTGPGRSASLSKRPIFQGAAGLRSANRYGMVEARLIVSVGWNHH